MIIHVEPELEATLTEEAKRQGVTAEAIAIKWLFDRRQLQQERRQLEDEIRQLRDDEEIMNRQMSAEHAETNRQRAELQRLRDEIRHEVGSRFLSILHKHLNGGSRGRGIRLATHR